MPAVIHHLTHRPPLQHVKHIFLIIQYEGIVCYNDFITTVMKYHFFCNSFSGSEAVLCLPVSPKIAVLLPSAHDAQP